MSVHICQTIRCHNWEYLWCQISFGVQKTNSNNFHIYTLSKLCLIQSIRVMHCGQGWDMSTWELRIWSLSCKNVVIGKSNYCSWPAYPWRQRHYNPSKCWELLAQQHSITILQTGMYTIWDFCWLRILRSHVTVCSLTGADVWGEGITSICLANLIHTITPQQTVTHAIPTTSTVQHFLYPHYITFMSACDVVTLLQGFSCFCTQCWDTFIIKTCPCIFSSPL